MAKAKKAKKRVPKPRELTWDDRVRFIIASEDVRAAIEKMGDFPNEGVDACGLSSEETLEEELSALQDRYDDETDFMVSVICDLIERLESIAAATGVAAKGASRGDA